MSLLTSMFNAVSGMRNHSRSMDIISNNIANVNTIGYKSQRLTFADALSQTLKFATGPVDGMGGTNAIQIGLGSEVASVSTLFSQGVIEKTGIFSDLAIDGDGFFIVKRNSVNYYTRNGQFVIDAIGNLVSAATGAVLQGYLATEGLINKSAGTVNLTMPLTDKYKAKQTSKIEFLGNLRSTSDKEISDPNSIDIRNLSFADTTTSTQTSLSSLTTSDTVTVGGNTFTYGTDFTTFEQLFALVKKNVPTFSAIYNASSGAYTLSDNADPAVITSITSTNVDLDNALNAAVELGNTKTFFSPASVTSNVSIYDSQGNRHLLKVTFSRSDNNLWSWSAISDISSTDETTTPPTTSTIPTQIGSGEITFNADGSFKSTTSQTITFPTSNGTNPSIEITLDFGAANSLLGMTQVENPTTLANQQDGYTAGDLSSLNIDQFGKILGSYTNGQFKTLGQVVLARFRNNGGLDRMGESLFAQTINSGDSMINTLEEGSSTKIISGGLESSGVDLTEEFSRMIITQRGYQANARLITTSDEMTQDLIALKR